LILYSLYFLIMRASTFRISHLQFANDALIMGKKLVNIWALKAILILFELILGLKVNFQKSLLVGVNVSDSWLVEAVVGMKCIPFVYLGLSIDETPRRLSFWQPLFYRGGRVKISQWVIDLCSLNMSCCRFQFILFHSLKLSHV